MKSRNPRLALAAVIAEGFLGRLAFGMLSFAFPLYARSLGLSLAEIGLLISLRSIVVLPLKPVAGWLADRAGIRAVYLGGACARTLAAGWLLFTGDFMSLALVRVLQGASAAGRDVASLGVVVRDAKQHIASAYSWYASAKHVGGVMGAGLAGVVIAASGGTYRAVLLLVLGLSILPLVAAWFGLREVPATEDQQHDQAVVTEGDHTRERPAWMSSLLRELAGPAMVGMLVAASAYMVHGIFPVLATEYAGLTAGQAGVVYSLSAVVFLLTGPFFGWLSDRHGRVFGLAWRSSANVGSSLLYLASPTFAGIAIARAVDDSGKAAFRPAWASAIGDIAGRDPKQSGRRLGALDTAATAGEIIGPALAGILWQSGGIVALFAVRIVLAIVAEVSAIVVFGELRRRLQPSHHATAAAYLLPFAAALAGVVFWLGGVSNWGTAPIPGRSWIIGTCVLVLGVLLSGIAGHLSARAERVAAGERHEQQLGDLRHDVRRSLTVIQGEVELVLAQDDSPAAERQTSCRSIIEEVERITGLLESNTERVEREKAAATSTRRQPDTSSPLPDSHA